MGLIDELQPIPRSFDKERGQQAVTLFPEFPSAAKELIVGVAGSSDYLATLLHKEADWLAAIGGLTASERFEEIIQSIGKSDDLATSLRQAKRRAALLIALADLGGVWDLDQVTSALSRLAAVCIDSGLSALLRAEFERGKLPMCTEDDLASYCGMTILGMGKLGADELNYSSDVDLISLFDESRYDPDDYAVVRKTFVGVTQKLVKLLSEFTSEGYVFRTDLRLRPDPAVTPVCFAIGAAEHYYESVGRTWERAAMIKARPVAGDIAAGNDFLRRIQPFIWRRHLDFAAVAEAREMLAKIREHKQMTGPPDFAGFDVKLGLGGIREIEFFAQTHQLIFGGRDPSIRSPRTMTALSDLAGSERISTHTADLLASSYTKHRVLEHRIQMLDDAQTHQIPKSEEKRAKLAHLCGLSDPSELEAALMERIGQVHGATELEPVKEGAPALSVQTPEIEQAYEKHETNWFALPALRNNRAREIYSRLRGDLIRRFAALSKPDEALLRFEQFLSGLPSGVQLFSLFENQPTLLDLLVDICAVSPALAEYLGQNKSVLDAVLDQNFFEPFDTLDVMKAGLDQRLADTDDYEYALDEIRRWQKERHFRNGVHLLRGISTHEEVAHVYSSLAEISISAALPLVERNLGRRFGPPPGRGAAILAMGRLGSREMTARSDLDLIVVYDGAGQSETNGPKSISVGAYYSRFTQALISALTVPTSEGRLYEVDLRLRPSGRKGPVATSLTAFADYQLKEAWTWEHLALTRARVVSGSASLAADVAQAIDRALSKPRDAGETLRHISNMRAKLAAAFSTDPEALWETKKGPGGLLDIELFLQSGVLLCGGVDGRTPNETIPQLLSAGWLSDEEATGLLETHKLLSGIQQVERLVGPEFDPLNGSQLQKEMLLRVLDEDDVKNLLEKKVAFVKSSDSIITQRVAS